MSEVATTKPRGKTAKAAPTTFVAEADFLRGRDLAVAMLAEADELQHVGQERTYHRRAYRDGHAQNRFTEKYIEQLIEQLIKYPTMRDGFNAVLSAKLGDQVSMQADFYAVPMAEYQAGAIGADGTALCDDDVEQAGPAQDDAASASKASDQPESPETDKFFDAYALVCQATEVAKHAAQDAEFAPEGEVLYGLLDLLDAQAERARLAIEAEANQKLRLFQIASDRLASAIALFLAVADGQSSLLLDAAASLLEIAKRSMDDEIESLSKGVK